MTDEPTEHQLPGRLVQDILAGRVVAFVGAGFSMPRAPSWVDLLRQLADGLADDPASSAAKAAVDGLPDEGAPSRDLEAAAQRIRDVMDEAEFLERLRDILRRSEPDAGEDSVARRVELLGGIPFRAVLTTNFDGYIPDARPPGPEAYQDLLRGDRAWWQGDWSDHRPDRPVIALHGSVDFDEFTPVFTRRDYLELVHGRHDYRPFLRALLMTNTVLFLGFSFSDAYINELRSEVQSLFDSVDDAQAAPLAYAALPGISDSTSEYLLRHERIGVIPLDGERIGSSFTALLQALHDATNPERRLQQLLSGRTVAWIDPNPANNGYGYEVLRRAQDVGNGMLSATIMEISDTDHWATQLRDADAEPDVIITHWGHGQGEWPGESRALEVLRRLRADDEGLPQAPVIVFGSGDWARANRRLALDHGAVDYQWQWAGLFRELEGLFESESG